MWLCVYGNFETALKVEAHRNCADDSDRTRKALRKAVVDIAMTADNIDPMILKVPTFPKEMSKLISALHSWDFRDETAHDIAVLAHWRLACLTPKRVMHGASTSAVLLKCL